MQMSKVICVFGSDARLFVDFELGQSDYLNWHTVNDTGDPLRITLLERHRRDRRHNFEVCRGATELDNALIRSKPFDGEGWLTEPDHARFHLEILSCLRRDAMPKGV